jgi:proteasome accessory factor A
VTSSRMLFGVETELAFTALDASGATLDREQVLPLLMESVARRLPHLTGETGCDLFLGNGARLYIDCGLHPEWSTPECTTPAEVVSYLRAGEQILARAAQEVEGSNRRVGRALLFKCNVDYVDTSATWGSHESYLYTRFPSLYPGNLIPHLVSRVIFTGAGGLNPNSPGIEFTLSPRVAHLEKASSTSSTDGRGIFHAKHEPLAMDGYHRLHLIAGESLCSQLADYLRVGTTALIVKLIEAGIRAGEAVRLAQPLGAMQSFVADPRCRTRAAMAAGTPKTAIEIQRHYLEQVEAYADAPFMPAWTEDVCRRWRDVLDSLESDPHSMSATLDWPIKLSIFKARARQHGIDWDSLPPWNRVLDSLPEVTRSLSANAASLLRNLHERGLSLAEGCDAFRTLRSELCEIDTRFGQLGPDGIFAAMDEVGVLEHRIVGAPEVSRAVHSAPAVGRARLRGEQIQQLSSRRDSLKCNWHRIIDDPRGRVLDLGDPFRESVDAWRAPSRTRGRRDTDSARRLLHVLLGQ